MKKLLLITLGSLVFVGFYACKSEQGTTTSVQKEETVKKEETTTASVGCSKQLLSYEVNIKPIMATYCTRCHAGEKPPAGFDLSNGEVVKALAMRGTLNCVLTSPDCKAMPPEKKLPKDLVDTIHCWVKNNAP